MKDLVYGNISQENLKFLKAKNIFTSCFNQFSELSYPDYEETTEEIEEVINVMNKAQKSPNWKNIEKFMFECDGDITFVLKSNLSKIGIPITDEYINYLVEIGEELGGLIMQLKNHYQRPRPYQVAWYSKQNLHPYTTTSGNTPSFPSGHACQGKFLTLLVADHYPEKAIELRKLSEKISQSRIMLGVHYPSDNKAGERIAKQLFAQIKIKDYI